jgi:hypothetical protein
MPTGGKPFTPKMAARTAIVVSAFLFIVAAVSTGADIKGPIVNLRGPLFSTPAFVLQGQSIALKVAPGAKIESAVIEDRTGEVARLKFDITPDGYSGSASPPLKPGLYNLRAVTIGPDGQRAEEFQPDAVAVLSEFKKTFDFAIVSDVHFGAVEGRRVRLDEKSVYRQRRAVFEKLKTLNFEFILLPGDLNLYPDNYHNSYPESYDFLTSNLDRPVFIVPGNHDLYNKDVQELGAHVYGSDYWAAYYGPLWKSFRYDGIEFVGLDTCDWPPEYYNWGTQLTTMSGTLLNAGIQEEQFDWLGSELEKASDASEIVVFTHIPLSNYIAGSRIGLPPVQLPGVPKKKVIATLMGAGVKNVFAGHLHMYDNRELAPGLTEHLVINVAGNFLESPKTGFVMVHVRDGKVEGFDKIDIDVP